MATTTVALADGSVQVTCTDDATGRVVWVAIAPPPGSPGAVSAASLATLQQLAAAAAVANPQDVTQDQAAVASAATISGTTGTLTALQLSNAVRQLAQGIALLAQNDVNTKKELNVLIRLALGLFDGTS